MKPWRLFGRGGGDVPRKRRSKRGPCRICGVEALLSFEHVPPKKAFNDRSVWRHSFDEAVRVGLDPPRKGKQQQQGGAGAYTLCEKCNNDTGSWYADDFSNWCQSSMSVLEKGRGSKLLPVRVHGGFPLRIVKQILTMFCSVNPAGWVDAHPALRRYLLNPAEGVWPEGVRVFVYYTPSLRMRFNGVSARIDVRTGGCSALTEMSFPPFGYVLTFDGGEPPDSRLAEISYYRSYGYEQKSWGSVLGHVLPVELAFSGDYRTRQEIEDQVGMGGVAVTGGGSSTVIASRDDG